MKLLLLISLEVTKKVNYVKMKIRISIIEERKEETNETQKKAKLDVECMYVDANHYD